MGGNYDKSIYNQLMEVMSRLDSVEKDLHAEKQEHREDVERLNTKINDLTQENQLLRDDNARLKSIINNNSSNTSLPPSTAQKSTRPANAFNGREKTGRRAGGQKGHKGTTLSESAVEEKLRVGKCRHEIRNIGDVSGKKYITKYVVDLSVEPLITEIHIYADGKFNIPPEYHNDVTYGPDVKALAVALYSEGVMANDRIAYFLNAASKGELGLSEGSVYSFNYTSGLSDRQWGSLSRCFHGQETGANGKSENWWIRCCTLQIAAANGEICPRLFTVHNSDQFLLCRNPKRALGENPHSTGGTSTDKCRTKRRLQLRSYRLAKRKTTSSSEERESAEEKNSTS